MNLEQGVQFIIFLVLFGLTNYLMMLKRYEKEIKKRQLLQKNNIANLYPKGTFINLWPHDQGKRPFNSLEGITNLGVIIKSIFITKISLFHIRISIHNILPIEIDR